MARRPLRRPTRATARHRAAARHECRWRCQVTPDLYRLLQAERTEAARRGDRWLVDRLTSQLSALHPTEENPMPNRSCLDCGRVQNASRCPECQRIRDRARGSRQERGYGTEHDRARRNLVAMLPCFCGYGCGRLLQTAAELVAAHRVDGRPEHGWIASCARCNQRARADRQRTALDQNRQEVGGGRRDGREPSDRTLGSGSANTHSLWGHVGGN